MMKFAFVASTFVTLITTAIAYDNGVAPTPPMGWSTWCTNDLCGIPDRCSDYEVRRKADAMFDQGLVALGYKWILLDDCWSDTSRDENGELQPSPRLFPYGMQSLVEYVHSKGMYIGLYTCIGTETCKKNRPGSYGYYETDANTMAKWNVDMVKADYCYKPANESGKDLYTQFSQALNATGHPMLFAMCQWGEDNVTEWGGDIAQMYRIQMDHIPFWSWPHQSSGAGYGGGVKQIINFMADLHPSRYNRPHAWMDPDFLETLFEPFDAYSTMNYTNSRTEYTFWSLWSSPLLMATDPADLSDEKKSILMNEEVIAINQDVAFISGERVRNDNETTGGQVWSRLLSNGDLAVVLYNSGNSNQVEVYVTFEELATCDGPSKWAIAENEVVFMRDLWEKKDMGEITGEGFSALLDAHEVVLYRLSKYAQ